MDIYTGMDIYKGIYAKAGAICPGEAAGEVLPALRSGGVLLSTTDTVCGLLTRSLEGVARIFEMKKRPPDARIAILTTPEHPIIRLLVREMPLEAWMRELVPGPLTMVVPAAEVAGKVPADVLELEYETYGFRAPYYPPLWPLIDGMGGMLFATSANAHGAPAPDLIAEVDPEIAGAVDAILDGGNCPLGLASAVAVFGKEGTPEVKRQASGVPSIQIIWEPFQSGGEGAEENYETQIEPYWTARPLARYKTVSRIVCGNTRYLSPARRDMLTALAAWSTVLRGEVI